MSTGLSCAQEEAYYFLKVALQLLCFGDIILVGARVILAVMAKDGPLNILIMANSSNFCCDLKNFGLAVNSLD